MIFDTHAHYDDVTFDADREEVLSALPASGIGTVVNICADLRSLSTTRELCRRYDYIYGAAGIHPHDVGELTEDNFTLVNEAASAEKIVAVGEIGLDYHYPDGPEKETQQYWFRRQLSLAREIGKPVVIHSREAASDTLAIFREMHAEEIGGVVHCFSYSKEIAREVLNMGFYLGIGGVLTYKNGRKLREVVEYTPKDRIVLETDAPYLAPEAKRRTRNDSRNLTYVIDELTALWGMSREEVIALTEQNARELYRIG